MSAYTSYPVTINIQGGKIKNCNATGTGSSAYGGGGICLFAFSGASFQMDGGTIEGCSCADSKYGFGGGVLLYVTGTHDVQFKKGTIKDNRAIDGGGLFVWQGHAVVDDGFGLYNNTASDGGDDIYNYRGKVTLGTVDTSATLEPCKHPITDWYEDVENRWSYKDCTGKDDYLEPFTHTGEAYSSEFGVKAAHGEFKYTVTWLSQDGKTTLEKDEGVDAGVRPEYNSEEPTKAATDQYTYTFAGWAADPDQESGTAEADLPAVAGNTVYYAAFSKTLRKYTVKWMNGNELLETDENVDYGSTPEYNGKEPTKAATEQHTYTFAGWEPEIKQVTGDATYKAVFAEKLREYTVNFDSRGGSSVGKETVPYGNTVSKPADPELDGARFVGWFLNGKPYDFDTPVHGDFTVVAMWIKQVIPTNDPSEDDPGDNPGGGAGGTTPGNNGNNGNRGNGGNGGNNAAAPANPAAAAPVAQNAPANTVIADNETPLDDGETILDDPVPQAVPKGQWALINLICTILTVLGAAGLATRRRKDDEDEDEDTGRKRNMCKIGAAVCAVISVIVLFLTEDFTHPMQMLDKYTILMIVILALCAAFLMLYRILSPEQEEIEE